MVTIAEEWIHRGRAQRLPAELSIAFDAYLSSLPWHVSSIDWSRIGSPAVLNVVDVDSATLRGWLSRTRIGAHSHMAVWYSKADGGLIVPNSVAIESLDELYRSAPGVRYAFGVTVRDGELDHEFSALLEYGRGDLLSATR